MADTIRAESTIGVVARISSSMARSTSTSAAHSVH